MNVITIFKWMFFLLSCYSCSVEVDKQQRRAPNRRFPLEILELVDRGLLWEMQITGKYVHKMAIEILFNAILAPMLMFVFSSAADQTIAVGHQ